MRCALLTGVQTCALPICGLGLGGFRLGLGGLLRLGLLLLFADGDDLQDRVLLAMAVAAAIIVPAALLDDDDLLALGLRHALAADGKPVARLQLAALTPHPHVAHRHLLNRFPPPLSHHTLSP